MMFECGLLFIISIWLCGGLFMLVRVCLKMCMFGLVMFICLEIISGLKCLCRLVCFSCVSCSVVKLLVIMFMCICVVVSVLISVCVLGSRV